MRGKHLRFSDRVGGQREAGDEQYDNSEFSRCNALRDFATFQSPRMTPPFRRFAAQRRKVAEHEETLRKLEHILEGLRCMGPSPWLTELISLNTETTATVERCLGLARRRFEDEKRTLRVLSRAALERHSKSIW